MTDLRLQANFGSCFGLKFKRENGKITLQLPQYLYEYTRERPKEAKR